MNVRAWVEVQYDDGDVSPVLDKWTLTEVRQVLAGDRDALDELATQASNHLTPDSADITLDRKGLEAYVTRRTELEGKT